MIVHVITANVYKSIVTNPNCKCLRLSVGCQIDLFTIFPVTGSIVKPAGNINIITIHSNCFSFPPFARKVIPGLVDPVAGIGCFPCTRSIYRTINNNDICCPGSTGKFDPGSIYPIAGPIVITTYNVYCTTRNNRITFIIFIFVVSSSSPIQKWYNY